MVLDDRMNTAADLLEITRLSEESINISLLFRRVRLPPGSQDVDSTVIKPINIPTANKTEVRQNSLDRYPQYISF